MALGAQPGKVRTMVLKQVAWMTAIGGSIGLAAALGGGRLAESLLFQMNGRDPFVLGVSVLILLLIALGAGMMPAYRASRVDPMRALRYE
jgi:ABC-type antimicrobial peptide transport system permease subunit